MGETTRELSDEELQQEADRMSAERKAELRGHISEKYGQENLDYADHMAEGMDAAIKHNVLAVESPKDAEKALDAWREFTNAIQARLMSENLHGGPEMVETVLRMAAALVQPEADNKGKDAVKQGMTLIKKRYSGVEK